MPKSSLRFALALAVVFIGAAAAQESEEPAGLQANLPASQEEQTADAPSVEELAEDSAPETNEPIDPKMDELNAILDQSEREATSGANEEEAPPRDTSENPVESFLNVAMWLFLLLAGFIILAYLYRGFGRRTKILPSPDMADLVGRVYLTPNTTLHFVRTGGKVLVIGVAPNHIALLKEFGGDEFGYAAQAEVGAAPSANVARFMDELKSQQNKLDVATPAGLDMPDAADDDIDTLRSDIARLRGMLREEPRRDAGR